MDMMLFTELTSSPMANAAIIVGLSLAAALVTDLFVTGVLRRLVRRTSWDLDDRLVDLFHRPLFLTILLAGAALALRPLGYEGEGMPVVKTLLVILWVVSLLRAAGIIFRRFPGKIMDSSSAGQHFGPLLRNITVVSVLVLGAMGVLSIWNISVTPLLASAGLAGAAVAFAAKDTIANFLGGVSILFDRPYLVGHYINLESGERGAVVDIGLRSTRIKTRDDILITVPNSIMANSTIVNESAPVRRFRVRIPIGVAYGSDIEKVESVLMDVAAKNAGIEEDPPPRVRFRSFGDSSLNFELLCWADDPMNRGRVIHELNSAIYGRFAEEGIAIPFPQRDVHLHDPRPQDS